MVKKRKGFQEVESVAEPLAVEEATSVNSLRASLEAVKQYDGVIGYILRNTASAAINLRDPTKITEYAILSSSALEAGKVVSELFDLGDINSTVVDGKSSRMIAVTVGDNKVSVFMDKNADSEKVLRRLHES